MATYKDVLILVDKVTEPLKKINKSVKDTTSKMNTIKTQLKDIGGKFTKFAKKATLAFTVVAGAVSLAIKKTADYGDRIDKMSQKIGMSRKAFQEWDYIMSQNGGSVESLQMGFKTLTTQIEGVQKGSKDSINAFKSLGVSVKNSNGQFKSQDEIFNESIRKLQQIKNPTQKAMLANRLFGRSAAELRPLLNQEADAIDDLREKANKLGLIVSDKDIDNAVKLKDTFDTFTRAFQARFATLMMKVMPYFTAILEKIIPYIKVITDYITNLTKEIVSSPAFAMMTEQFNELGKELKNFYEENKTFFDALKLTFKWLVTSGIPNLLTSLTVIIKFLLKLLTWVHKLFAFIGGAIGNLVGRILSIPNAVKTAFLNVQTAILRAFIAIKNGIGQAIRFIIERLANMLKAFGLIVSKIPALKGLGDTLTGIGNGITNNTTNNTTNITNNNTTNNYNNGGSFNFTPLRSGVYAVPVG